MSVLTVTLTNPGATPTITANATGPQIADVHRLFIQKTKVWKEWNAVGQAAKQVIIDHIPEKHYRPLKKKYTGLATVTYLEIYNHLLTKYGLLLAKELLENDIKMKTDITAETDFEDLVQQIEDGAENAASQTPYMDKQTVAIGLALVSRSGYVDE